MIIPGICEIPDKVINGPCLTLVSACTNTKFLTLQNALYFGSFYCFSEMGQNMEKN